MTWYIPNSVDQIIVITLFVVCFSLGVIAGQQR